MSSLLSRHNSVSLDEAINNFRDVVTTLDMTKQDVKYNAANKRRDRDSFSGSLKSAGLISKLGSPSAPSRPPAPAGYTPSPPPPPTRTSASSIKTKTNQPPSPPTKTLQSEAAFKRLQNQLRDSHSNKDEAVKNLSNLMNNIEQFKTQKIDDDLELKLDNLTDQLMNAFDGKEEVNWQNGKPPVFHSCNSCGELIKSDTILAGPHHYHQGCFTCHHCHVKLGDNFYVVNDRNYCLQHKDVSLQHCSVCQQVIAEGGLLINAAFYHLQCFKCSKCQQILDGTYYTTDSGFLCKHDFMETLAKCAHCQLPINDKVINVKETKYHPACFNCHLCNRNLDGVPFLNIDNSVNCVECYKKYKAAKCSRCQVGITEENISCNGQFYHKQCYTCKDCGCNLYGQFVCCVDTGIICFMCDTKRRNEE